jgi:hypothetical protein
MANDVETKIVEAQFRSEDFDKNITSPHSVNSSLNDPFCVYCNSIKLPHKLRALSVTV